MKCELAEMCPAGASGLFHETALLSSGHIVLKLRDLTAQPTAVDGLFVRDSRRAGCFILPEIATVADDVPLYLFHAVLTLCFFPPKYFPIRPADVFRFPAKLFAEVRMKKSLMAVLASVAVLSGSVTAEQAEEQKKDSLHRNMMERMMGGEEGEGRTMMGMMVMMDMMKQCIAMMETAHGDPGAGKPGGVKEGKNN
jgi:hypothetical protein